MKKVLLYSGGMDSWLIDKIWKPDIKLYIDINGRYSKQEISKLPNDVIIEKLDLSKFERDDKIIPLRNLYLIMIASYYGEEICLGATAGDRVLDKSFLFATMTEHLLNYLYTPQWWLPDGKKLKINLDYKNYTKSELLHMYMDQGGSLEEVYDSSFSCYEPTEDGHECWNCKPCFRKWVTFAAEGFIKHYKPIPYIEKNVLPLIADNSYGRDSKEEDLIVSVYNYYQDHIKGKQ